MSERWSVGTLGEFESEEGGWIRYEDYQAEIEKLKGVTAERDAALRQVKEWTDKIRTTGYDGADEIVQAYKAALRECADPSLRYTSKALGNLALTARDELARLKAPVSDEVWKLIEQTVATLTIWSQKDFRDSEGFQPMWNPTLRRLRNLIAERDAALREVERLKAPVNDEEWGKGCHLANRAHVNAIIANRAKPLEEKP